MSEGPRIIIFSGKGGVGKTTAAAATGVCCSKSGMKTIVISIDIAHSLSDSMELNVNLNDVHKGLPRRVMDNLWVQEVDIQEELGRHWGEVSNYLAALLGSAGISGVLAEELAVIPGMEDVISLLYINQYYQNKSYDVIIVDCAPTGESLRFISMPTTLEWYINKLFKFERNLMKLARPIAKRLTDVILPEDSIYQSIQDLFIKLEGVDKVLKDTRTTSVRLVTNAERMVVRETQRAFMYFCLYGLVVDAVIVNRLYPDSITDNYFKEWHVTQQRSLEQIKNMFDPIPLRTVPLLEDEVVGIDRLSKMGSIIYGEDDPSALSYTDKLYDITEGTENYLLKIKLPFVSKDYVDLFKENGELVIRIGSFKRHVYLPRALQTLKPAKARLESNVLTVVFPKE